MPHNSREARIRTRLLSWAKGNSRQYPWRDCCGKPYPILVAEILLKRTTATAVARIYSNFLVQYPTLEELEKATEEELLIILEPIGLYRQRSRDFRKITRHLTMHENGTIPDSLDKLLEVPGLGAYSARAILSFGYGIPAAVVDGNVTRIIGRLYQRSLPDRPTLSHFQAIADKLLPQKNHCIFNFTILDLGALVCRQKPKCMVCPILLDCDFSEIQKENGSL